MTEEVTLKPCPFCGGKAFSYEIGDCDRRDWAVECEDCSNRTSYCDSEAEAIAAWNTRTISPAVPSDAKVHLYIGDKTHCGVWLTPDVQRTVAVRDVNCKACLLEYAAIVEGDSNSPMRVASANAIYRQAEALPDPTVPSDAEVAELVEQPRENRFLNENERLREALIAESEMSEWQAIETAPKDAWILIRGRNSAGFPMVPVVCSWRQGAWRDAASGRDMTGLIADVPPGHSADWAPLPEWQSE